MSYYCFLAHFAFSQKIVALLSGGVAAAVKMLAKGCFA